MIICDKNVCVGCGACSNTCSKKCIDMVYDEEGFLYPKISASCTKCGKCKSVCPALNPPEFNAFFSAYIGHSKNEQVLLESTSGGLFTEISNVVFQNGGYICAAKLNDDLTVSHDFALTQTDLKNFRGSKYIQSETQNVFFKVKELLERNVKVAFFGTPCQVAGLKVFLKKTYKNLLTIDFICHGVASKEVYSEHINSFNIDNKKDVTSMFRNKKDGYVKSKMQTLKTIDGVIHSKDIVESTFVFAYSNNLISRLSCGTCLYACKERVSDITLADYMKDDITDYEREKGASLILCNTQNGYNIIKQLNNIEIRETNIEKVITENIHLNNPSRPHENRNLFFKYMSKHGYIPAAQKYFCVYGTDKKILRLRNIKRLLF